MNIVTSFFSDPLGGKLYEKLFVSVNCAELDEMQLYQERFVFNLFVV